jgi:hypothetical protein
LGAAASRISVSVSAGEAMPNALENSCNPGAPYFRSSTWSSASAR